MSYYPPITIRYAIEKIDSQQFLLPAIQREFVWSHDKIEQLFDSIMRDYPIGSLLTWKVRRGTKVNYKFYTLLKSYREIFKTHCEEIRHLPDYDFEAILDGQQRLTALYIGLKGTYAYRLRNRQKQDNEHSIPTRRLYLSLIKNSIDANDNEDQRQYDFRFLTDQEANSSDWFEVGKILSVKGHSDFNRLLRENKWDENIFIADMLSKLHEVVHTSTLIYYYMEEDQDYDKALNIFIRINSGGEKLTYSDLIMSTIIFDWPSAKAEFAKLISEIRDIARIDLDKDLIIKSYLLISSITNDIKFSVKNFSMKNTSEFRDNWHILRESIVESFKTIVDYGYDEKSLTSMNAILPIIYYLYISGKSTQFSKKIAYKEDRVFIKKWLNMALIKRIFGGQSDSVIKMIRDTIKDAVNDGFNSFPMSAVMQKLSTTNKSLNIDDEFIEGLLYTQYDDVYTFSILSLLYPHLDYKNGDFHKDHIFPKSLFTETNLKKYGIEITSCNEEYYKDKNIWNGILNLQLLDANENKSKNDKTFEEWAASGDINYEKQLLPRILQFDKFPDFINERKIIIKEHLNSILRHTNN